MKHIRLFETVQEHDEAYENEYFKPWVAFTRENGEYSWNKKEYDPRNVYFTLDFDHNEAELRLNYNSRDTLYFSLDNGETWNQFNGEPLPIRGGTVALKGNLHMRYSSVTGSESIPAEGYVAERLGVLGIEVRAVSMDVYGNPLSVVYGDNFRDVDDISNEPELFKNLFYAQPVVSAENLYLPAMNLAEGSYSHMFDGCGQLVSAPELPATGLAESCYASMFKNCTSLESIHELPATSLVYHAYANMFVGCTSLNHVKCMSLDAPGSDFTPEWFTSVSASGTFESNPDADWEVYAGTSTVPSGWTITGGGHFHETGGGGDGK